MRKYFFSLTLVLLGLFAGANTMCAVNMSGMTDEDAVNLAFWARMTAKPATTTLGSGLVFVSEDEHSVEPGEEDYQSVHSAEGWSDIYLASSLISATVDFKVYAKANAGSYFTGSYGRLYGFRCRKWYLCGHQGESFFQNSKGQYLGLYGICGLREGEDCVV